MFDFGIFCHPLRLMEIYRKGAPSGLLKSFVLSFLFFLFFFFLHIFVSLSHRGPFSSGAYGHCPPMPPSRYATGPPWVFKKFRSLFSFLPFPFFSFVFFIFSSSLSLSLSLCLSVCLSLSLSLSLSPLSGLL